ASAHDWLQGRGPQLTLIGFQDDATKQILTAHFQLEAENTLGYLRALHSMITRHGVPLSLYRDRHSIFQRNDSPWTLAEQLAGRQTPPHLGRAWKNSAFSRSPPIPHRLRVGSNASGALVRTAWSANSAWLTPQPWRRPTPSSPPFARTTTSASPALP